MFTDYQQIIFPTLLTALETAHPNIQLRVTLETASTLPARVRGQWTTTDTYAVGDIVCDATRTFWRALTTSTNQLTIEGTYWTAAFKWNQWACPDKSKVLILDPSTRVHLYGGMGQLERHISLEEAKITPDHREFHFADVTTYSGVDGNGNPVSGDFIAEGYKTMFAAMFRNPDSLATFSLNRVLNSSAAYDNRSAFELYWLGDANIGLRTAKDKVNYAERGPNALQIQEHTILVDSFVSRSQTLTVEYINAAIIPVADLTATAFYANMGIRAGKTFYDSGNEDDNTITPGTNQIAELAPFGVAYNRVYPTNVTINAGLHKITWSRLLAICMAVIGYEFDEGNSITTMLRVFSDDIANFQTKEIVPDTGLANITQMIRLVAEFILSSDPRCNWGKSEMSNSAGYSWNTPISTVLEKESRGVFGTLRQSFDQSTKMPAAYFDDVRAFTNGYGTGITTNAVAGDTTLILSDAATFMLEGGDWEPLGQGKMNPFFARVLNNLGRWEIIWVDGWNTTDTISFSTTPLKSAYLAGSTGVYTPKYLPAKWRLNTSEKGQQKISGQHVAVTTKGFKDALVCPHGRGTALDIEMPHGVKMYSHGCSTFPRREDMIYNSELGEGAQASCFYLYTGSNGGKHIYLDDCTVTHMSGLHPFIFYAVYSPSADFTYLKHFYNNGSGSATDPTSSSLDPNNCDVVVFPNGAYGQVRYVIDRNTIEIWVADTLTLPVTGAGQRIIVGYSSGRMIDRVDSGWIFDLATCDSTGGSAGMNSTIYLKTSNRLDNEDMFGNKFKGQQIILPNHGVFTIQDIRTVDSWAHSILTLNAAVEIGGTGIEGRIGGPDLNPDSWVIGSYMYYDETTATPFAKRFPNVFYVADSSWQYTFTGNTSYPESLRDSVWLGSDPTHPWIGSYCISRMTYGDPVATDNHGCSQYSAAQIYRQAYIGSFACLTRQYAGGMADDDTLTGWNNGDSFAEFRDGKYRFFRMIGHSFNEFTAGGGSVTLNAQEWPDCGALLDDGTNPVRGQNSNQGSGSTSNVNGSGASGASSTAQGVSTSTDLSKAVILSPVTPHRNSIKAPVGVVDLELYANGTDNVLAIYDATGTLAAYIDTHGTLEAQGASFASNVVISGSTTTTGIANSFQRITEVDTPVLSTDAATKGYVDSASPNVTTATGVLPAAHGGTGQTTGYFSLTHGTVTGSTSPNPALPVIYANSSGGAVTVTYNPTTLDVGKVFWVKDSTGSAAAHSITITPSSGTIDGAANFVLNQNWQSVSFYSDGTNLRILSNSCDTFTAPLLAATDAAGQSAVNAINDATSGTINASRLSALVTVQGNTFNGIAQLVKTTGGGLYPALDGSLITNLTGAQVSGTVPTASNATNSTNAVHAPGLITGAVNSVTPGTTKYAHPSGMSDPTATLTTWMQMVAVRSRTISTLYITTDNGPGTSKSCTFTLYKNGSATSVTCSVANASTTANDTSNSFTVVAGDTVSMQIVSDAGSAVTSANWGFETN